jgi:hypothetical protein
LLSSFAVDNAEGLLVLRDVVEIFAERVAQADFLRERQPVCRAGPRRPAATALSSTVILRCAAMLQYADGNPD